MYILKVQKHGTELVTWLHFLFYNFGSKPHCCPYKEAGLKAVKVVNFATKWLNLYPHTVLFWLQYPKKQICVRVPVRVALYLDVLRL